MLYYPTFYEGLEQSKNVIYTGQEATQQIIYGLDWVQKEKNAKSFFLIGSDYIWPRTSNKIARKHIENFQKGKVVGEEYYPLGHTNFNSLINKIKVAKPDCVYAIVVGGSNVAFYKQMKAAGITSDKQLLLTISVTEDELLGIGGENCNGFYACMKYFQSLDNANNKKFVEAFKAKYGAKEVIGDVTQAAYLGPVVVEGDGREGRQLRHRQGGGSLARHRAEDGARGLREDPREPPPLEQGAHRPDPVGRAVQADRRIAQPHRAEPLPQGLSVIRATSNPHVTCAPPATPVPRGRVVAGARVGRKRDDRRSTRGTEGNTGCAPSPTSPKGTRPRPSR
jgi:hypothetical protein